MRIQIKGGVWKNTEASLDGPGLLGGQGKIIAAGLQAQYSPLSLVYISGCRMRFLRPR